MFKRFLLATDGSPVVERQIVYAEHLARVEPGEIIVLHAYAPPAYYANYPGYDQLLEQYSGIKRWALGSIADKVLHAATTPLVLVRAKDRA